MKSLSIPFLPGLNALSVSNASDFLDENGTRISVETINWPEAFGYRPLTTVCIGYSETAMYLLFQVHGNCLRAVNTQDNQDVYQDSCVEFFVKQENSDFYYNFEFNCIGVCKAGKRLDRNRVTDFTQDQYHKIERWASMGNKGFHEMSGLFSWELCVKIPFELIEVDPLHLPDKLLGNFYKCADATEQPHYVSWSPIKVESPDFHRPEFFGEMFLIK